MESSKIFYDGWVNELNICTHILILGKIEDWRRRGRQRKRELDGITNSMD